MKSYLSRAYSDSVEGTLNSFDDFSTEVFASSGISNNNRFGGDDLGIDVLNNYNKP